VVDKQILNTQYFYYTRVAKLFTTDISFTNPNRAEPTFLSWALEDEAADAEQENILRAADTGSKVMSLVDMLLRLL